MSPSDGLLEELGYAEADQLLQAKRFRYRIADFLALDAAEAEPFSGGATATIYLAPHDYHRVHMPLGGRVTEMVYVPGRRWAVNRRTVRTVPGLFAANERVILWCENAGRPLRRRAGRRAERGQHLAGLERRGTVCGPQWSEPVTERRIRAARFRPAVCSGSSTWALRS